MPDPALWAIAPYVLVDSSHTDYPFTVYYHSMAAVIATDESEPVQYYFDCVSGGGIDSGWIDIPTYTTSPFLSLNHSTYQVCARDIFGNITAPSVAWHTLYGEVPEPATIFLFGLAALMLRRRK
jgi:hypothetical protein